MEIVFGKEETNNPMLNHHLFLEKQTLMSNWIKRKDVILSSETKT